MFFVGNIRRWTVSYLGARRDGARRKLRRIAWDIQVLEERLLLTAYTPAQVSQAYNVNQIMFGTVKGDGTGQTIAIVDAYHAPNIQSDLAKFNATFGLPNTDGKGASVLTVATPQGTPAYNKGWAQEITLDVQWAHAIAPGAHILLVEAKSNSLGDLLAAVDYARNQPGVSVVSMSWGSTEFSTESAYDSYFTTPSGHTGVSFVASAGDTAAISSWPAVSPNVMSVGGTTLSTIDTIGTYGTETVWSNSGGGISLYESKPSFQSTVTQSGTKRTSPDVAYDANPSTGVQVYFTDASTGSSAWYVFGGTSIGAPQWAGIVAIANQGRALAGKTTLDGKSQLLPALYSMASTNFHDVTSGGTTNGTTTYYAGAGYDLVTGRGSPYANRVVTDLLSVANLTSGGTTSGGTTSGGTTSGGSTKGGKPRPKFSDPHADGAGWYAAAHFAFGDASDLAGQFANDRGVLPSSSTGQSLPTRDDFASRFSPALTHTGSDASTGHSPDAGRPSIFSSQISADAPGNREAGQLVRSVENDRGWHELADRKSWSEEQSISRGATLSPTAGTEFGEWSPSEFADAYFVSLAQGDELLPLLEAA